MRVSDSARLLFVHVQKTGGVSVEQILDQALPDVRRSPLQKRHEPLGAILQREPELAEYWIFGFVRNPWARMWSWWSMICQAKREHDAGEDTLYADQFRRIRMWRRCARYGDFETFCQMAPAEHPRIGLPQLSYLTSRGRRADFVGRTETFAEDMRAVFAHLDLPLDQVPHANRGQPARYRDHYTQASRERVGEVYAEDVAAFGYSF